MFRRLLKKRKGYLEKRKGTYRDIKIVPECMPEDLMFLAIDLYKAMPTPSRSWMRK